MTTDKSAGRTAVEQLYHLSALVTPPHYRDIQRWCVFTLDHTPVNASIGVAATHVLQKYMKQIETYQNKLDSHETN